MWPIPVKETVQKISPHRIGKRLSYPDACVQDDKHKYHAIPYAILFEGASLMFRLAGRVLFSIALQCGKRLAWEELHVIVVQLALVIKFLCPYKTRVCSLPLWTNG